MLGWTDVLMEILFINPPPKCITEWQRPVLVQLSLTDWGSGKTTAWINFIAVLDEHFVHQPRHSWWPKALKTYRFCIFIIRHLHHCHPFPSLVAWGFADEASRFPFFWHPWKSTFIQGRLWALLSPFPLNAPGKDKAPVPAGPAANKPLTGHWHKPQDGPQQLGWQIAAASALKEWFWLSH